MFKFFMKHGVHCATSTDHRFELFANWISSDIQASKVVLELYLDKVNKVKSGSLVECEKTGNMYTLSLGMDGAQVIFDDEYSDVSHMVSPKLPLEELVKLLKDWKTFISK